MEWLDAGLGLNVVASLCYLVQRRGWDEAQEVGLCRRREPKLRALLGAAQEIRALFSVLLLSLLASRYPIGSIVTVARYRWLTHFHQITLCGMQTAKPASAQQSTILTDASPIGMMLIV